jgi:hypothetical protein
MEEFMSNSETLRYHWLNFMRGIVLVAIVWATVGIAQSAAAHNPISCVTLPDYGMLGGTERTTTGSSAPVQTGLDATKADVKILAANVCEIIDSVYVYSSSNYAQMEVGTVSGWFKCDANHSATENDYTGYYATPVLFYWAVDTFGHLECLAWIYDHHPTTGSYNEFRASNLNHNYYWGVYFDTTEMRPQGVLMDWQNGSGLVAQERGNGDPGLGRFNEIQEAGSAGVWSRWDHGTTDTTNGTGDFDYYNSWQNGYTNNITAY